MSFSKLIQYGGKTLTNNYKHESTSFIVLLVITIVVLLIRTAVVCLGYNMLMPKFIQTIGNSPNNIINFRELKYGEALILVIVVQCLIGV
jgi:hypothetical protein